MSSYFRGVKTAGIFQAMLLATMLISHVDLNIYVISYDDGTPEDFYYRPLIDCGEVWYVNMFTVPCRAKILSIILYINNSWPFYFSIFRQPPSGLWKTLIDNRIGQWWRNQPYTPEKAGWVTINLEMYEIWVEGDFYFAIKPTMNYTLKDNLGLGLDKSQACGRSFLWYRCMMGVGAVDGNFMIRAKVGLTCEIPAENRKSQDLDGTTISGLLRGENLMIWGADADRKAVEFLSSRLKAKTALEPDLKPGATLISVGGPVSNPLAATLNRNLGISFNVSSSGITLTYHGEKWIVNKRTLWSEDYGIVKAYSNGTCNVVFVEGCTRLGTLAASYFIGYNLQQLTKADAIVVKWVDFNGDKEVQLFECMKIWINEQK